MLLLAGCQPSVSLGEPPGDTAAPIADTGTETLPGETWTPPDYDTAELPDAVPTLNIEISAEAMARLDADPYGSPDETGTFTDAEGVEHTVDLNYRGAYALLSVMQSYDLRNWKVKFAADDAWGGFREWNFNYEPDFRQELTYDVMRFAGVAVPSTRHVVLEVNGEYQGIYLQYEDPDNKAWLAEQFGDDSGDLYKAAYDLPYQTQYFADLTVLGDTDTDYLLHYNQKLGPDGDYTVIRTFVADLNGVSDADLPAWIEANVDVERLRSYLVVSNFVANWDSYPQRPKNYWLYQDPRAGRMVFVPWDLNSTFGPDIDGTYNQMGTSASVLYDLLANDYTPVHENEGTERPLVRRLMGIEGQRTAYIERYRELSESLLSRDWLEARLDALDTLVAPVASTTDRQRLQSANASMRTFIERRTAAVQAELEGM